MPGKGSHDDQKPTDCMACTSFASLPLTSLACADCQAASSAFGADTLLSGTALATATAASATVTAWNAEAAHSLDPSLLQQLPADVSVPKHWQGTQPVSRPESSLDLSDAWAQQPGSKGTPTDPQQSHDDILPSRNPKHPREVQAGHSRSLLSAQQDFAWEAGSHELRSHQPMDQEESESQGGHGRSLLRRGVYKRAGSRPMGSQGGGIWQGGRKRVSRRLDATGADAMGDPRGAQQSIQELVGKQRQRPTPNRTEFEREQLLLKAHFRLDIGEGPARSKSPGPRTIPRGLQPAQGFFDGATHQVHAHPHCFLHCPSAAVLCAWIWHAVPITFPCGMLTYLPSTTRWAIQPG